jgi:hypothetical protein
MTHLLPSSANLAGFFACNALGFVGLVGRFTPAAAVGGATGTELPARSAGFLCVISLLSTLRRPFVTSAPRLRSANTAPMPSPPDADEGAAAGGGGGAGAGGGGGGGGGAPVEASVAAAGGGGPAFSARAVLYSAIVMPYQRTCVHITIITKLEGHTWGFQAKPVVWCSITYLRRLSRRSM